MIHRCWKVSRWGLVIGGGVCGVGKGLNDSSVQTEQAKYDWIDTGTIWYKWWRTDRVKFRDAIASKNQK